MKHTFLVAQIDYDYPDNDIERRVIEASGGRLVSAHLSEPDEIVDFAREADGIIVQYAHVSREVLSRLPKCKVVSRYGIGLDNVDVAAARDLGVVVAYNPSYCIEEVSDHAVALMQNLLRQVSVGTDLIRRGSWDFSRLTPIKAARDTVIGIFGFGKIGRRFAQKAHAFGYQCIACDPYVEEDIFSSYSVTRVSFTEMLGKADCISIHCALNDETRHIFNADSIAFMKKGSFIVNTSRGLVIESDALFDAVENMHIRGAALDVLPEEPPKKLHRAMQLPSVILTPHVAFYSDASIIELRTSIAEQVVEVLKGGTPRYCAT